MDTKSFFISFVVLILAILFTIFLSPMPNLVELADVNTCPICYGDNLCSAFRNRLIYILPTSLVSKLVSFLCSKKVYIGLYNGNYVVLKKLAHNYEQQILEHNIFFSKSFNEITLIELRHVIQSIFDIPFGSKEVQKRRLCPSAESINKLMDSFKILDEVLLEKFYINIITILHMNPETFFLQILQANEGWPVPKYFGSCGRISVVEHCGSALSSLSHLPWQVRAGVANQLITAAFNFTFSHPQFAFYLTDVSMDNIAVSEAGIAKFIDLEDVIVVDKNPSNHGDFPLWNDIHASECLDSLEFAFSSDDICSHHISDHNVYAVCWEVLSPRNSLMTGGLVHSPPDSVLQQFPEMMQLIDWCIHKPPNESRFSIAKRLQDIFTNHIT